MPVKVVSEGPVSPKRTVCSRCRYELEFTGEDVTTIVDADMDATQTIVCPRPSCKSVLMVKWP